VDDLVVDGQLTALVVDDKDADAATAVVEALGKASEEAGLVKDREALLDVTSLGHGNDVTVITDIKDTVLLEDRAEHVLDDDRRAGVADEGRLLVQLLGEEVNTEVAVLASLSRGGDADDLARTALQDQQVADPDVVAGDGDGVGNHGAGGGVALSRGLLTGSGADNFAVTDNDILFDTLNAFLLRLGVGVVVVVVAAVDRVENFVRCAVETVTEAVVVAVFVVISHITLVLATGCVDSSLGYANLFVEGDGFTVGVGLLRRVLARVGRVAFPLTGLSVVLFGVGSSALTEVSLGCVDAGVEVVLGLAFVSAVLYVDLGFRVTLEGLTVVVSFDVDVNTAIETLVVEAVLGTGVEAVLTALFETVLAAGVAAVVLVNADFLFSADASGTATVFLSGGDADVLADALLVTGRAGLLGLRLLLLFPSSALDCYLLLSLDLFGLLVVSVGRRKDAERDWDSGVEIQPGDLRGTRVLCKTATRLAKQTRPIRGEGEGF
jgi:hypothetical protein